MTRVIWYPERKLLRVSGHAGSAPEGEDLLCAAISTLTWTLGDAVTEFGGEMHLDRAGACVEIRARPTPGEAEERCGYLFRVIVNGFRGIAEKFPEYLGVEER